MSTYFTTDQENAIRHYMGFSFYFQDLNPRLESQIQRVGNDASTSAIVVNILAHLATADLQLAKILKQAGLKSATAGSTSVEWHPRETGTSALSDARKNGRMWCGRRSVAMGTPLVGDLYGEGGYMGDGWANQAFQYGDRGGGGSLPMG